MQRLLESILVILCTISADAQVFARILGKAKEGLGPQRDDVAIESAVESAESNDGRTDCQRNQSLAVLALHRDPLGPIHYPHCNAENGQWHPIQCIPSIGMCWCVDPHTGRKIPGTRLRGQPQCDAEVPSYEEEVCSGKPKVRGCSPLLCAMRTCPGYPDAHCRINPCGDKCEVLFFSDDNKRLDCTDNLNDCQKELHKQEVEPQWFTELVLSTKWLASYIQLLHLITEGLQPPADSRGDLFPSCFSENTNFGFQYKQCSGDEAHRLCWCVNNGNHYVDDTIRKGDIECDENGLVDPNGDTPRLFCDGGVWPQPCNVDICNKLRCLSHYACYTDPCSVCNRARFFDEAGTEHKWESLEQTDECEPGSCVNAWSRRKRHTTVNDEIHDPQYVRKLLGGGGGGGRKLNNMAYISASDNNIPASDNQGAGANNIYLDSKFAADGAEKNDNMLVSRSRRDAGNCPCGNNVTRFEMKNNQCTEKHICNCAPNIGLYTGTYHTHLQCLMECEEQVCAGAGGGKVDGAFTPCDDNKCNGAVCPGFPEAVCQLNTCTCEPRFVEPKTRSEVSCGEVAGVCARHMARVLQMTMMEDAEAIIAGKEDPPGTDVVYNPQCGQYGEYLAKQCDDSGECWCVDYQGERNDDQTSPDCSIEDIVKLRILLTLAAVGVDIIPNAIKQKIADIMLLPSERVTVKFITEERRKKKRRRQATENVDLEVMVDLEDVDSPGNSAQLLKDTLERDIKSFDIDGKEVAIISFHTYDIYITDILKGEEAEHGEGGVNTEEEDDSNIPDYIPGNPNVVIDGYSGPLEHGSLLSLACSVSAHPDMNFQWKFKANDSDTTHMLNMKKTFEKKSMSEQDSGRYTCEASKGSLHVTGMVDVLVQPSKKEDTGTDKKSTHESLTSNPLFIAGTAIAGIGFVLILISVIGCIVLKRRKNQGQNGGGSNTAIVGEGQDKEKAQEKGEKDAKGKQA